MFNVNNKDTRITPINAFFIVFLMLTLNGKIFAGRDILSLPVVRLTNKKITPNKNVSVQN